MHNRSCLALSYLMSSPFPSFPDNSSMLNNVLSMSPMPSAHSNSSSDALRKEIATLEAEILHLERYLLSLYRTAFEERLPALSNVPKNHLEYKKEAPSKVINQSLVSLKPHIGRNRFVYLHQTSPAHGCVSSDDQSYTTSVHSTSTRDRDNADSRRHCLADHLGASCFLNSLNTPDKLSEDIVRCISSIYCKFSNTPHGHGGWSSSPPSSLSSSSIFSSRNPCDNWSPQYSEDTIVHHQGLKEDGGPYAAMVEVLKIWLEDDSFNYAAEMLKNFRSLVRNLEKVDPRKMKREEKIAFWINIHNALVMHAYLAYGTHNRVKASSILKAGYNIGGHCINACVIQNSIFGIRSHYSEPVCLILQYPNITRTHHYPWVAANAVFSSTEIKDRGIRHVYALEYPEPLVHFALCSGAYSDPAVRVYTAKNIFQELKVAKEEFIQAGVYIHKETKIYVPKILSHFAKDMSMDMPGLLEAISGCLTEAQRKAVKKGSRRKHKKSIHWLSQSSSFRYLIDGALAKGR